MEDIEYPEKSFPTLPNRSMLPLRQIRALYDSETITVYQAYNTEIATQAVQEQKLDASTLFKPERMTWVKPSWCWMMYRSGYSYKDENQEKILAIKMRHADFTTLLGKAVLTSETARETGPRTSQCMGGQVKTDNVKVQWDPERSVRLERLNHRSIQIGIRGMVRTEWIENWIVSIEDVTEKAKALKAALHENQEISEQELLDKGILPAEQPFEIPASLRVVLGMD